MVLKNISLNQDSTARLIRSLDKCLLILFPNPIKILNLFFKKPQVTKWDKTNARFRQLINCILDTMASKLYNIFLCQLISHLLINSCIFFYLIWYIIKYACVTVPSRYVFFDSLLMSTNFSHIFNYHFYFISVLSRFLLLHVNVAYFLNYNLFSNQLV